MTFSIIARVMVAMTSALCDDSSMQRGITVITTSQLAASAGVDPSTVRTWVHDKKLAPAVTTPGGHYRFDRNADDVVAIIGPPLNEKKAS